ncbi:hypothetical protein VNO77_07020 [Canavalia gladiata]|uniref:Uncharacterized protein n=1 Tax=Canavalia gladiata TaxID=3824 RepID=A0AAN9QVY2_CANGL
MVGCLKVANIHLCKHLTAYYGCFCIYSSIISINSSRHLDPFYLLLFALDEESAQDEPMLKSVLIRTSDEGCFDLYHVKFQIVL